MKIVITGSLGNIGKPLTEMLVKQGQSVTVISSKADKQKEIEALGASAAIGSLEDVSFLTRTFVGADAVYCMIPLDFSKPDLGAYLRGVAGNYVQAIKGANIKRAVVLSGWVADLVSSENAEGAFDELSDISFTVLRPGSFYTNFYTAMDLIRGKGFMGAMLTLMYRGLGALLRGERGLLIGNCGGDDKIMFVSPTDIANAAAEELLATNNEKKKIRYVGSEELTCNEAAKIIGTAIAKPYLKWVLLTDKQMLQGLKMAKMPDGIAGTLVEMQAAMHSGIPLQNFHKNNPPMGKIKLKDFAREFAVDYNKKYAV